MNATVVILAGGKSSRMGSDKGLVSFKGQPMIQHVIDEVKQLDLPIIIIANNDDYDVFGYPVYKDLVHEKGPVGGIYTALSHSKSEKNIVVSCDTPFVTKEILTQLLNQSNNYDVVIPSLMTKEHPLIGVYDRDILGHFKQQLDLDQLKLKVAYRGLKYKVVPFQIDDEGFGVHAFSNLNTREELKRLEL